MIFKVHISLLFFTIYVLINVEVLGQETVIVTGGGNGPFSGSVGPPLFGPSGTGGVVPFPGSAGTHPGTGATTVHTSGQGFVCVPIGTCPPATIDVRIITPGNQQKNPCPLGQEPCYTINGANTNPCGYGTTQCGTRLVTVSSTADGYADQGAYPWQAFLLNLTGYAGSGVLLDPYHVLTAAHKVQQNLASPGSLTVYMGIWDSTDITTTQYRTVSRITIHPEYNRTTLKNDLAILTLSSCIVLGRQNTINTACLPSQGQSFVGQNCIVSGWGQTNFQLNDAPTMRQKQVTVPIVPYATCRASYSQPNLLGNRVDFYLDPNGEFCAGGQSMRDACTQDGGSPLVCMNNGRFTVVGIVIWGKGCGSPGVYGVYTNVAYYVNWIQSTLATS